MGGTGLRRQAGGCGGCQKHTRLKSHWLVSCGPRGSPRSRLRALPGSRLAPTSPGDKMDYGAPGAARPGPPSAAGARSPSALPLAGPGRGDSTAITAALPAAPAAPGALRRCFVSPRRKRAPSTKRARGSRARRAATPPGDPAGTPLPAWAKRGHSALP